MSKSEQLAPPVAASNLTGLNDLAAAAYSVSTSDPVMWNDIGDAAQARWIELVSYILDVALPSSWSDQGPELDRIRGDSIGARGVAEVRLTKSIEHRRDIERLMVVKRHYRA